MESLLKVVELFSSSMCMSFGLNKCTTTSVMRGKLVESSNVALADNATIQALDVLDFYKLFLINFVSTQ